MLADPLVLTDASAANKSFSKISQSGADSLRRDTSVSPSQPRLLRIRHQATGRGTEIVDRHNVLFSKQAVDGDGNPRPVQISVAVSVARDGSFDAEVADLRAFALDFVGDNTIWAAFLGGES